MSIPGIITVLPKAIDEEDRKKQLAIASKALLPDYTKDKKLTIFTLLDGEDFYD